MNKLLQHLDRWLPDWAQDWLDVIVPTLQVALILLAAALLYRLARRLIQRASNIYGLPSQATLLWRRAAGLLIYGSALLWGLERLGVSGTVLWAGFTSFAAVAAVAFFAAWSVLSNVFCALLILTSRMFRLDDFIELQESGDKRGFRGRVLDFNLVYTTLQESGNAEAGTRVLVPNSLFFVRVTRRWHGGVPAAAEPPPGPDTPVA